MTDDDDSLPEPGEGTSSENTQAVLVAKLIEVAGDPVYEMKTIFGVNHRTAERWISGKSTMPAQLHMKLALSLMGIAEQQRALEKMPQPSRLYMQIAATRVKVEPYK